MKAALITRSTLFTVPGGDTVQVEQTARELAALGVTAEIVLAGRPVDYRRYNLLHFFNLTRPADFLHHARKSPKPFVVSPIFCDYSEYDRYQRKGIARMFSGDGIEYLKTTRRWLLGRDCLASKDYLWKGQRESIIEILHKAAMLLPNSISEYRRISRAYFLNGPHLIVPNGADTSLFTLDPQAKKDDNLVICAARIEGIKNQLNLIRALNNTRFKLVIIGSATPGQPGYYAECRRTAAGNVSFIDRLPQNELADWYRRAKVHVLPSWFETTGLSSVEAAAMGCNIVITSRGDTRDYFGDDAFYCEPGDAASILQAVEMASAAPPSYRLREKARMQYTWKQAALQTFKAYKTVCLT